MSEFGQLQDAKRPEADLARRVATYLLARGVNVARLSRIEEHGGVVTLRGQVASQRDKNLCVSICQRVAGVLHVIDELQASDGEEDEADHSEIDRAVARSAS